MMRKELGVQSQQIELYNIYELLYTYYVYSCVLLLAPLLIFFVSKCERERKWERKKRVRVFVLGVWGVSTCAWACRPCNLQPIAHLFIYLFYIFVLCVSSQGKEEEEKKTFYTIGRFLHLLVRVWQTGKHLEKRVGNGLEDFFVLSSCCIFFWLWIWLDLIESESRCWRIIITYRGGRDGWRKENKRNENFFGRWDAQHTRRRRSNNINHEFVTRRQPYNGTHALWL